MSFPKKGPEETKGHRGRRYSTRTSSKLRFPQYISGVFKVRNAIVFPISSRPPLVCGGEHPSAGAHQDGEAGGAMQKVGIFLKGF